MMNSRGFITVDYLFAFFLVAGFSMVIMTFSATLSMVETVQYVAFAGARNFFAGNMDLQAQQNAATKKMSALASNKAVAPLLSGNWFKADIANATVNYNIPENANGFSDYTPSDPSRNLFHGVIIPFQANILAFQIPFFGSTTKSDSGGGSKSPTFSTNITAFLGREPTYQECSDFNQARWQNIKNLSTPTGSSYQPPSSAPNVEYVVINDNGC